MTSTHQRPPLPPNFRSLNQDSYRFKAVLRSNIPDVAIIYSNTCTVSCEWAVYITNLMKNQGYKTILVHEVESFSAASTPGTVFLWFNVNAFRLTFLLFLGRMTNRISGKFWHSSSFYVFACNDFYKLLG